jgi:hypothetical protein
MPNDIGLAFLLFREGVNCVDTGAVTRVLVVSTNSWENKKKERAR